MVNWKCSYNDIAVVDVLIDNLSLTMTLSFGKILYGITGIPTGTYSYSVCQAILDPSVLPFLVDSSSSKCTISDSTIIILLSKSIIFYHNFNKLNPRNEQNNTPKLFPFIFP